MIKKENVLFGIMYESGVEFSTISVLGGMVSAGEHLFRGTDQPISGFAIHGGDSPDYYAVSFSVDDAFVYYGKNIVMIEPEISLEMALDSGVDFGGNVFKREDGIVRFFGKSGASCVCKMTYTASNTIKFYFND